MSKEEKLSARHLTKRVTIEKDSMTYRLLSRELGITIKAAKLALSAFIEDPATRERMDQFTVTWVLSGILKPEEDAMDVDSTPTSSVQGGQAIILAMDNELNEKEALFIERPTKEVYGVSPSVLDTIAVLSAYSLASLSSESKAKWGVIPEGGYGGIECDFKPSIVDLQTQNAQTTKKPARSVSAPSNTKSTEDKKPKTTTKTVRPMGALSGLFADRNKTVPAKRKASPPPVKRSASTSVKKDIEKKVVRVANGIFDEQVSEEESDAPSPGQSGQSQPPLEERKPKIEEIEKPKPRPKSKPQQAGLKGFFK